MAFLGTISDGIVSRETQGQCKGSTKEFQGHVKDTASEIPQTVICKFAGAGNEVNLLQLFLLERNFREKNFPADVG